MHGARLSPNAMRSSNVLDSLLDSPNESRGAMKKSQLTVPKHSFSFAKQTSNFRRSISSRHSAEESPRISVQYLRTTENGLARLSQRLSTYLDDDVAKICPRPTMYTYNTNYDMDDKNTYGEELLREFPFESNYNYYSVANAANYYQPFVPYEHQHFGGVEHHNGQWFSPQSTNMHVGGMQNANPFLQQFPRKQQQDLDWSKRHEKLSRPKQAAHEKKKQWKTEAQPSKSQTVKPKEIPELNKGENCDVSEKVDDVGDNTPKFHCTFWIIIDTEAGEQEFAKRLIGPKGKTFKTIGRMARGTRLRLRGRGSSPNTPKEEGLHLRVISRYEENFNRAKDLISELLRIHRNSHEFFADQKVEVKLEDFGVIE